MHCPTLNIDLAAIIRNYRLLASKHPHGTCAAVVKANAYGLGVSEIAPALAKAGCREFFVATLEEGIELREALTARQVPFSTLYVFHGARQGEQRVFAEHRLIPILNSMAQWELWDKTQPFALHIDTGMTRLGLGVAEAMALPPAPPGLQLVLSHLSCSNRHDHPLNAQQLQEFARVRAHFAGIRASLANSSGVFLGPEYHFDLLRPGCSLYGISPMSVHNNPMENVVRLCAPVLQIRTLTEDRPVSYAATVTAPAGSTLATVEIGYADGFQRHLTGKAFGYAHGVKLPVLGRVTMDMVIMDISGLPVQFHTPQLRITFIGEEQKVDALAKAAGTIGYEIFTGLGRRVRRIYTSGV